MSDLLTMAEAAKRLAISPKHLRQEFVNKGILAVVRLGSSAKGDRIIPYDIDRLIADRVESRCYIKEVISGGLNIKPKVSRLDTLLGRPRNVKLRLSSVS
jgi:hypothetical protein